MDWLEEALLERAMYEGLKERKMTKQEEIREGMRSHLVRLYTRCFGKEPEGLAIDYIEHCLKNQEVWLVSQGVVLKVEREEPQGCSIVDKTTAVCPYKEAGYAATESLIE